MHQLGKSLWRGDFPTEAPFHELFAVTADGREKANLASEHPTLVAELRAAWETFDTTLLPYPAGQSEPIPIAGLAD